MIIPCEKIALNLKRNLVKRVKKLKKRGVGLKIATIFVGTSKEQLSFIASKRKIGEKLGVKFELIHFKDAPRFDKFIRTIKNVSENPENKGVIIQQPLPARLYTETLYEFIPLEKEIESHKNKSPYIAPIGLAVLTLLKYVFYDKKISDKLVIDEKKDANIFKQALKHKKIVLIGRGKTGGTPIGRTLSQFKINYININSQTPSPETYYQEADVIISAVGKKVLNATMLKPGVSLINIGLRRENGKLKGDYDEKDIKKIAGCYTTTPKGAGPIDVLYLYKNLIDASEKKS
jgi:methylenetetrahydrofolate dehydrogenase (NADP+)/methenyltetrahydrofolate cyclohydrolase